MFLILALSPATSPVANNNRNVRICHRREICVTQPDFSERQCVETTSILAINTSRCCCCCYYCCNLETCHCHHCHVIHSGRLANSHALKCCHYECLTLVTYSRWCHWWGWWRWKFMVAGRGWKLRWGGVVCADEASIVW